MFWYLLVQRNVLKNSAFPLKSAVVRCSQFLLWKNTKLVQNDGQILIHRRTGIFDLIFQPNLVYIKQITISGLVFKCSGRTAVKTVLLSSSCLKPSWTNESTPTFRQRSQLDQLPTGWEAPGYSAGHVWPLLFKNPGLWWDLGQTKHLNLFSHGRIENKAGC